MELLFSLKFMFHFIYMQGLNKNKAYIVIFLSDTKKTRTHTFEMEYNFTDCNLH